MVNTSHPDIKFDWYQTESHVIINILLKQLKPENVKVELIDNKLSCYAKLPNNEDFHFKIELAHAVCGHDVHYKVTPSKIEIRLKKTEGLKWTKLDGSPKEAPKEAVDIRKYPSSKKTSKDWDKLAQQLNKEEAAEKPEGEEALNQLFQKIYADGSDELRKAMNKSFVESGGTVLSTSWEDVARGQVEVKPPDGTEFKKWDS